jgi:predicted enzyme related to lactoylglutathione lyase
MKLGYALVYVDDVEKTMIFYAEAFQLTKGFLHESKQYGEMITGETKLGFVGHETAKSHGFEYEELSLQKKSPGVEIGFLSDDVRSAYAIAIKAGATPVTEPVQKPWGQIVSYVRDCNGLLIEICSPM